MSNEPTPTGFPKFQKFLQGREGQPKLTLRALAGNETAEKILAEYRESQESQKVRYLGRVRTNYKWPWGKGAVYLYRELIRTLELEKREAILLDIAENKPGRKKNFELAARIYDLKDQGKTARQICEIVNKEGAYGHRSLEAVEAYLKTRRKRGHS